MAPAHVEAAELARQIGFLKFGKAASKDYWTTQAIGIAIGILEQACQSRSRGISDRHRRLTNSNHKGSGMFRLGLT